ncbi:Cystinosin [Dactylellina cionopaga]|nr:Cystinosin [Dactylellina cionopaga]
MSTELFTWRDIAQALSWIVGWTYFALWTISFYPQLLQNRSRRSTLGVATSYFPLNILGFLCYTLYTSLLLYSSVIRAEYAVRYPNAPNPTVRSNDLAFALHACVLASVTYSQFFPSIWGYEVGRKRERTQPVIWGIIVGIIVTIGIVMSIAIANETNNSHAPGATLPPKDADDGRFWAFDQINYLDVTTAFSMSKLLVTLVKYLPQIYINYTNKSTEGFSIWQILLDFFGGFLSLVQLGIDSALEGSWEGVTGNLVKTGLGLLSMALNIVFMVQHYVVYPGNRQVREEDYDEVEEGSETEVGEEGSGEGSRERGVVNERTPLNGGKGKYVVRDIDGDISE